MKPNQVEISYRRASIQEASPAGLTIILYDMLADDLRRAGAAMRSGEIEERCAHLKHALVVLQVLDGSLDLEHGGPCAQNLAEFYAFVRSQVLAAQFKCKASILQEQIALVLDVREAWRLADSGDVAARAEKTCCTTEPTDVGKGTTLIQLDRRSDPSTDLNRR